MRGGWCWWRRGDGDGRGGVGRGGGGAFELMVSVLVRLISRESGKVLEGAWQG